MLPIIKRIHDAFESRGCGRYGEEDVTQMQHALQSGHLALQEDANAQLVTAALLHDIGHILSNKEMPDDCDENLDDKHESKGSQFLVKYFGPTIADPVRLHVVAKRYLCTKEPDYEAKLSPTSRKSFYDQGGRMSPEEIEQFESERYYEEAIRLRHWDDAAKDPEAITPPLEHFVPFIEASLI